MQGCVWSKKWLSAESVLRVPPVRACSSKIWPLTAVKEVAPLTIADTFNIRSDDDSWVEEHSETIQFDGKRANPLICDLQLGCGIDPHLRRSVYQKGRATPRKWARARDVGFGGAPQRRRSPVREGPTQGGCWLNLIACERPSRVTGQG